MFICIFLMCVWNAWNEKNLNSSSKVFKYYKSDRVCFFFTILILNVKWKWSSEVIKGNKTSTHRSVQHCEFCYLVSKELLQSRDQEAFWVALLCRNQPSFTRYSSRNGAPVTCIRPHQSGGSNAVPSCNTHTPVGPRWGERASGPSHSCRKPLGKSSKGDLGGAAVGCSLPDDIFDICSSTPACSLMVSWCSIVPPTNRHLHS